MTDAAIRFDVVYKDGSARIEPHFCREWDADGGCYGTNPDHGLSFVDACDEAARWYEDQAILWRTRQHADARAYEKEASQP